LGSAYSTPPEPADSHGACGLAPDSRSAQVIQFVDIVNALSTGLPSILFAAAQLLLD
jgi:hypothetical protein